MLQLHRVMTLGFFNCGGAQASAGGLTGATPTCCGADDVVRATGVAVAVALVEGNDDSGLGDPVGCIDACRVGRAGVLLAGVTELQASDVPSSATARDP